MVPIFKENNKVFEGQLFENMLFLLKFLHCIPIFSKNTNRTVLRPLVFNKGHKPDKDLIKSKPTNNSQQ